MKLSKSTKIRATLLTFTCFCVIGIYSFFSSVICQAYTAAKGTISFRSVKVREQASGSAAVMSGLAEGLEVIITDEKKGDDGKTWYAVTLSDGSKGFIRSDLIKKGEAVKNPSTGNTNNSTNTNSNSQISSAVGKAGTVKGTSVRVRVTATTDGDVISALNTGDIVTVADQTTGGDAKIWYKVSYVYNGTTTTGYIRSDFIVVDTTTTNNNPPAAVPTNKTGTIKGVSVRIRTFAGTAAEVRCALNEGHALAITETVKDADGKDWYKVAFMFNNSSQTGYVRSDFVNLTAGNTNDSNTNTGNSGTAQKAVIKGARVNIREEAINGVVTATLVTGNELVISEEKTASDGKVWLKATFTYNNESKSGWVRADLVTITGTVQSPAPDTNTNNGTTTVKTGSVKGTNVNVRKEPLNGDITCKLSTGHSGTITEEKAAADGKVWYFMTFTYSNATQSGWIHSDYLTVENSTVANPAPPPENNNGETPPAETPGEQGTIKGIGIRVREAAVNGAVICQLGEGHSVKVIGSADGSDGNKWHQISFAFMGAQKQGFVRSDFVNIVKVVEPSDVDFETSIANFPENYKVHLRALHQAYPKWKFEPTLTGLEWKDVVAAQSAVGKNLVANTSPTSWKSTDPRAYNWINNAWYGFDGAGWVSASTEIVQFYLDPRNFLNDSGIFQFETLEYQAYQNEVGVASILASTFMANAYTDTDGAVKTYAAAFVESGTYSGINPYHLAARCLQEQGNYGTSGSVSGTVAGYENLFNFFNIGAYPANGLTSVINGLIYAAGTDEAYVRPWNSRYRSLVGGAKFVSETYVKRAQNTLYFQKFNVVNTANGIYNHQYMTNLQAASSEAAKMKKAYPDLNVDLLFKIPVYNNMPEALCAKPDSTSNPNNYLSAIAVDGHVLTPVFAPEVDAYALFVDNSVASVNIGANPIVATSSVSGTGTVELAVGINVIPIHCKAQNGATRTYTINIVRSE